MKKVRITVSKGSAGKRFPIFQSPEALFAWKFDAELQSIFRLDPTMGTTIFLRPGEVMEVEWMGCEYIDDGEVSFRVDQIRLAKTMKVKALSTSKVIGIHSGWITDDIISFKSGADEDVKRTRLTKKSKQKFDIEELFISRGLYDRDPLPPVPSDDLH